MELPQTKYVGTIKDVMAPFEGDDYSIKSVKKFWGSENDYKGDHLIGVSSNGIPFELQFHTQHLFKKPTSPVVRAG